MTKTARLEGVRIFRPSGIDEVVKLILPGQEPGFNEVMVRGINPVQGSEQRIAEADIHTFCHGCISLLANNSCARMNDNDQARYVFRKRCGWRETTT